MLKDEKAAGVEAATFCKQLETDVNHNGKNLAEDQAEFLTPIPENIPGELKALEQWVCWRLEVRGGKKTKVPYHPTGFKADCSKPGTWASFDQVWVGYQTGKFDGIGFEFSESDPFAGVDLDHCINKDGSIEPWAASIVERLNSYTEKSPSGTGIHIFIKAKLPPGGRKKGDFECYESGRYLTMTGLFI